MEFSLLKRKQSLFDGYDLEPSLYKRKCLASLNGLQHWYQDPGSNKTTAQERTTRFIVKTTCGHTCALWNGEPKYPSGTRGLTDQISCWADTEHSVERVLSHLKLGQAIDDPSLKESVNKKFLEFHHDITEECGAKDKQHSWAVIEKQDEILMYGPYYPNYVNGQHSEDTVIKQTQELLESESASEDWTVYVFTMNSPCLARNTDPCMLALVQKAQEWWRLYGVKTNIGYMKCWGFKGTKENLFRDITYSQLDCFSLSQDYGSYVKAAQQSTEGLIPLCENLYCAVKQLLKAGHVNLKLPLVTVMQGQDWKSCFKNMHSILEGKAEDQREALTQDVNATIEAARALLSEGYGSVEEYLERGRIFALDHPFSSRTCDGVHAEMRLAFLQCWRDVVQEKYAEFIREKLTEDFNQLTVQVFIKDVARLTKEYVQIGRVQFSNGDS